MDERDMKVSERAEENESTIAQWTSGGHISPLSKWLLIIGLIPFGTAVLYVALQIVCWAGLPQNMACTYIALAVIPLAFALVLCGKFPYWVRKRRTVEAAELHGLYS
jgi:hypothetical protein